MYPFKSYTPHAHPEVWSSLLIKICLHSAIFMLFIHCFIYPFISGKTLLAKAVANQTSATFLRVVGSELIQKYLVSLAEL